MADDRAKVECDACGFRCVPQWLNDEAHCLKCQKVLKTRGDATFFAGRGNLTIQPGEVSTYKASAGSAMESQSGTCAKSPDGMHHWKFGKCSHCGLGEGAAVKAAAAGRGECGEGGKCQMKFAKCTKCGRLEGAPPKPAAKSNAGPTVPPTSPLAKAKTGGYAAQRPAAAAPAKSGGYAAQSPAAAAPAKSGGYAAQRPAAAAPAEDCVESTEEVRAAAPSLAVLAPVGNAAAGDVREKMECEGCGYKSVPQWLNDEAHCLKCQKVLKTHGGLHGYGTAGLGHPMADKRAPGEASTHKASPGSAMESQSGTCAKSPDGTHHWKFGKCSHCGKAEGSAVKAAAANTGGGGCQKGGKCAFKFAKCTKCGMRE